MGSRACSWVNAAAACAGATPFPNAFSWATRDRPGTSVTHPSGMPIIHSQNAGDRTVRPLGLTSVGVGAQRRSTSSHLRIAAVYAPHAIPLSCAQRDPPANAVSGGMKHTASSSSPSRCWPCCGRCGERVGPLSLGRLSKSPLCASALASGARSWSLRFWRSRSSGCTFACGGIPLDPPAASRTAFGLVPPRISRRTSPGRPSSERSSNPPLSASGVASPLTAA